MFIGLSCPHPQIQIQEKHYELQVTFFRVKEGFQWWKSEADVLVDIQGYSMSTLQEPGVVNPVLGSALWKLHWTSIDALMISLRRQSRAMKRHWIKQSCRYQLLDLVKQAAHRKMRPGSSRDLLQSWGCREGNSLPLVTQQGTGDVQSDLSVMCQSSCLDEKIWREH